MIQKWLASVILLPIAFQSISAAQEKSQRSVVPTQGLADRIGHTDPSKARHSIGVHDGPGSMDFRPLLGTDALDTNFLFLHRGVIQPKSGIGQHFHNKCEEMFIILDGEAQFTVDGRTSLLKGAVGVPDRMGHAHAIYNPTDHPLQWINVNVGMTKVYDAFNLGDPRVDVPLDPIPQFITMHLDRTLLKPVSQMNGGTGTVQYRRALDPSVFSTAWSYVDHLLIPSGSSVGSDRLSDMSEVYYVLAGDGKITVDGQSAEIHTGDAIPIRLNEEKAIESTGKNPLELMVIGVARDLDAKDKFIAATHHIR
jgi:mannose-6-phosphate isomerase-like protein (cupin superfamily)